MLKENGLLKFIFDLSRITDKARALKDTEKGKKTVRFTVGSIICSLFSAGTSYIANLCFSQDVGKQLLFGLFTFVFLLMSVMVLISALVNIKAQRIVNKSKSRFIALALFFVALGFFVYNVLTVLGRIS